MTSRRAFLAGLAAAALPGVSWAEVGSPAFLAAGKLGQDYVLHGLTATGDSLFQIALPYLAVSRAVRHLSALDASLILLVEPVLSPFWAYAVHREVPGALAIAGGVTLLAATAAKSFIDARTSDPRP